MVKNGVEIQIDEFQLPKTKSDFNRKISDKRFSFFFFFFLEFLMKEMQKLSEKGEIEPENEDFY